MGPEWIERKEMMPCDLYEYCDDCPRYQQDCDGDEDRIADDGDCGCN